MLEAVIEGLKRDHPVEVVSFTSADEALRWCRERGPDLCLVDYMMPGMNGLEFIAALRRLPSFAGLPIVMITGFPESYIRQHALDGGATEFWTKPVDLTEIRARLGRFLDRRRGTPPHVLPVAHLA